MDYVIGLDHKLGKQNIKQLYSTTYPSSSPSTPSYSYNRFNK